MSLAKAREMPLLPSSIGGRCNEGENGDIWRSENLPFKQAQVLVRDHIRYARHHLTAGLALAQLKAKKLSRPSLSVKDNPVEEETYKFFLHQWETYKAQANLTTNSKQHLESCLGDEITVILFGRLRKEG